MDSLQLNVLLLALGALQGIFLFALLYKKRSALPGYIFLAAYIGVLLLQVSMKIADKLWLMTHINPLYSFSYQLPFLYGPLMYLFIGRITNSRQASAKDALHFLPAIIFIGLFIFGNPYETVPAIFLPLFHTFWAMALQLTSLAIYHVLALKMLKQSRASNTGILKLPQRKWLQQLTTSSLVISSVVAVVICLMYYNHPHWSNVRFGFVALTIFIYWISYKAWSQPELFTIIHGSGEQNVTIHIPVLSVHLPPKKYSNSGLCDETMLHIIKAFKTKMQEDKLYLEPELTIDTLALAIACSRHHLSQALNEKMGRSFYDCVNHYRVEEAKILLADASRAAYKITSIAYDAGFNSISTFNDVFKKNTGVTPSQYRKNVCMKDMKRQRV